MTEKRIIKRAAKAFGLHAKFNGSIGLVKVKCNVMDDCEVLSTIIHPGPALILIKINIKTPVKTVFDSPMFSDRSGKNVYIRQRCNKISLINALDVVDNPLTPY